MLLPPCTGQERPKCLWRRDGDSVLGHRPKWSEGGPAGPLRQRPHQLWQQFTWVMPPVRCGSGSSELPICPARVGSPRSQPAVGTPQPARPAVPAPGATEAFGVTGHGRASPCFGLMWLQHLTAQRTVPGSSGMTPVPYSGPLSACRRLREGRKGWSLALSTSWCTVQGGRGLGQVGCVPPSS